MKRTLGAVGLAALCLAWAAPARAVVLCVKKSGVVVLRTACKKKETALNLAQFGGPPTTCPPDSVMVGPTCVDKYEASVWDLHGSATLLAKVQSGSVTLSDLTGGGATQVSPTSTCSPEFPTSFDVTGNWTSPLYAVSVAGVHPTACVSWFQANQACLLSGKRLLTNREWQGAAAGTPDPGTDNGTTDCAVSSPDVVNTGSRSNCKSSWGVFDTVGNVQEWVADWADLTTGNCTNWTVVGTGIAGSDRSCFGGPGNTGNAGESGDFFSLPGALHRGGGWSDGVEAGVFALDARENASFSGVNVGFRCAR